MHTCMCMCVYVLTTRARLCTHTQVPIHLSSPVPSPRTTLRTQGLSKNFLFSQPFSETLLLWVPPRHWQCTLRKVLFSQLFDVRVDVRSHVH